MNVTPISLLMIAVSVLAFEAIVYADDLAASSIISGAEVPKCESSSQARPWWDFFGKAADWTSYAVCGIQAFFIIIFNFFVVIASVITFFFNALTFNIPGAPFYARFMFGCFFIGGMGWPIASMFRGTKA